VENVSPKPNDTNMREAEDLIEREVAFRRSASDFSGPEHLGASAVREVEQRQHTTSLDAAAIRFGV
jgi:hypothetical protein